MNFITDPIGTRYGCKYTYTNGSIGTFDKITEAITDGRKIKDPLNIFGSYFKTVNCPDPYMVSITSILKMNTSRVFDTNVSALVSGTEEVTKEQIDFSKYKSVAEFSSAGEFMLKAIPKDQLFVTKDLLGVSEFASGINKITTKCTNLKCGMALSLDNTNWFTWNKTTSAWDSIDITQSTDTLKTTMCAYDDMNNITQAQYATQFPSPTHIGIALLLYIDGTDTNLSYTVDSITLDYVGDDNDATPSTQYFNFVKTGYTPRGDVVLYADRTIQQGITYTTLYNGAMVSGKTAAPCAVGPNPMYISLPKTGISKDYGSEWDSMIADAGIDVTGSKSADDFFNTAITSITATVAGAPDTNGNFDKAGAQIICRGGDRINRYTNISNSASSADYGWRPRLVVDITSREVTATKPIAVLPTVTSLGEISKGKCISCDFIATHNENYRFENLGHAKLGLLSDYKNTVSGSFYFICVGYDRHSNPICVADRPLATGELYSVLNNSSSRPTITGKDGYPTSFDLCSYNIRHMMTVSGKESAALANEYDTFMTNEYDTSLAAKEIWHNDKTVCWTNTLEASDNARVIVRGITNAVRDVLSTDTTTVIGFRPMFVAVPQISATKLNILPYVGYELQTSAAQYTCTIEVGDGAGTSLGYKLINATTSEVLSAFSTDTERVITLNNLTDNAVTPIAIVTTHKNNGIDTDKTVYTFNVYKDGLYRSKSTRTFGKYYSGFGSDNVDYQNEGAAISFSSTNKEFTKTTDGSGAYVSISAFTNKVIV